MDTEFAEKTRFDPKDHTWWQRREMGSPDDPYNNTPKIPKEDPLWKEYVEGVEDSISLLYKEANTTEGWTKESIIDGIKVSHKDVKDSSVRCFKGVGIVNSTAEVIRLHLVQIDLKKFWDKLFISGCYYYEVTQDYRVCYYSFSAPWPVSPRDFMTLAGEKMMEDGSVCSAVRSIVKEDLPEVSGFVRGTLHPGTGFVLKSLDNAPDGSPRTQVTYVVQMEPNGWIPNWVVNSVNGSQVAIVNDLGKVVRLTETLVEQLVVGLTDIPEEEWSVAKIKGTITTILANNEAKPEMLWDPLRYLMTGKRIGDASIVVEMEKKGKKESLKKLWSGVFPYAKSIARPEMFIKARDAGYLEGLI
eukprot:TRINITY_DN26324_c0_g1_i1.p1 TRINITY_DN26324_c0_g1~~TRINITY_DN26324_c0_g1_i1.p1  ORF type:complete len:368 (+),score=68.07 TRINITY_DN26324_c0_g1_i1:31-1104(+)